MGGILSQFLEILPGWWNEIADSLCGLRCRRLESGSLFRLVEASKEGFGLGFAGAEVAGDGFSFFAVVALGADAHPIAVLAWELDHRGTGVLAQQLGLELFGLVLAVEGADLHAPAATGVDGLWRTVDVEAHAGGSGLIDAGCFCRCDGEIENSAIDKRSAVCDAHGAGLSGFEVGDNNERTHWKGAVCGREGVVTEDLAVGGFAAFIRRGVPGGKALFALDGPVGFDEIEISGVDSPWGYGGGSNAPGVRALRGRSGSRSGVLAYIAAMSAAHGKEERQRGRG